jgi:ferredoxin
MPQKVVVDENKCIGCNTCCLIDSDTFELDQSEFKAIVKKQPTEISDKTKSAIESCPVGAISLVDEG